MRNKWEYHQSCIIIRVKTIKLSILMIENEFLLKLIKEPISSLSENSLRKLKIFAFIFSFSFKIIIQKSCNVIKDQGRCLHLDRKPKCQKNRTDFEKQKYRNQL